MSTLSLVVNLLMAQKTSAGQSSLTPKTTIKQALRKKLYFIIGTVLLGGAWCIQSFIVDPNKDKISKINDRLSDYNNLSANISRDQFSCVALHDFNVILKDSDTTNELACVATWDYDYVSLKSDILFMLKGEDSNSLVQEINIEELNFVTKILDKKDLPGLLDLVHMKKDYTQQYQIDAQATANTKIKSLSNNNDFYRIIIIFFIIFGTLLINLDKVLEYFHSSH